MTDTETDTGVAAAAFTREPVGADPTRPSLARVRNRLLGGKDHYGPDILAAEALEAAAPGQTAAARRSREFQQRALRYLAGTVGIKQFLDLGAGLPSPVRVPQSHEVLHLEVKAQSARPTVVYVDNDPVCVAHGKALMEANPQTHYVWGDITNPGLLYEPQVLTYLDLDQPVGILLCDVLPHFGGDLDPGEVMRGWIGALPPGSYVALTHFYDPGDGESLHAWATQCERQYRLHVGSGWFRSREVIEGFFDGLELVAPGLVEPDEWWPYGPPVRFKSVAERLLLAGVGWKPGVPPRF
ncbi:SAM-dependent methyltransferase [Nocardia flavorosea]|uniref:S-adenosyl methyltransferase n=1 Tax=Nocardia flavorosea TaxID=53429 RepID=A0A846YRY6_9NOCA|nr:SAM-dependent methyltransferase [Nocardia flavorosea]NKY60441.1 hypothetical protein [Nocardia flavorosea]